MRRRDKYIVSVANAVLRLASPEYRDALKRLIEDGALSRAQKSAAPTPPALDAEKVTLYRAAAMNGEERRVGPWATDQSAIAHLGEEVQQADFVPVGSASLHAVEIAEEFERQSRWAQEDSERHLARGDDEASQLARERERVYQQAATCFRNLASHVDHLVARGEANGKLALEKENCERCKGSGVWPRQGCGEWISDPCPDCDGTGHAQPKPQQEGRGELERAHRQGESDG